MADLSQKTCLVYDYGYNIALARRLSREFGKVRYFYPWKTSDAESIKLSIGEGFPEIERVRNFSDVIHKTDLFVFPNIYDGDLQNDLVSRGKRVWGSRRAERLEYDRPFFYKTLEEVGLPVVPYEVLTGVDSLESYLRDNDDKWVKLNLRGDDETWRHYTWETSKMKVWALRQRLGPVSEIVVFTVVDNIESIVEAAYDGFMVASSTGEPQFPDIGFLGYEDKDTTHILTAIPYDDFSDSVREVNDKFSPVAARKFMRSGFGTEIKIVEEGDEQLSMFLDFTARQPRPPGEIILEQVTNLGEFFYHGAEGELIPLEIEEICGVQVILYSENSRDSWVTLSFPE